MDSSDDADLCERCDATLKTQRYMLRVDADPPSKGHVELTLCEQCMASLARWVTRKNPSRSVTDAFLDPGGGRDGSEAASHGKGKRGSRRGGVREIYARELDRNDEWVRRSDFLPLVALIAGGGGFIGLLVLYSLFGKLRRK